MSSPYTTPESELQAQSDDALWDDLVTFAGGDYYPAKWQPLHTGQSKLAGFNFAAFFVGSLWFVYRRLYVYAGVVLIAPAVIGAVIGFLGGGEALGTVGGLAFAIGVGLAANRLFYDHARRQILGAVLPQEPAARREAVRRLGKTNDTAVWVLVVVSALFVFALTAFVLMPT